MDQRLISTILALLLSLSQAHPLVDLGSEVDDSPLICACYSYLGRTGGKQVVSLARYGCVYHGVIQHELNHALGFYHEHTRSDRDEYVKINWENVPPHTIYNFQKQDTNNLNTPYDYTSVMHYGRTAFSTNGMDTMGPITTV